MSIKIYDFYKVNEDFVTINKKFQKLRQEIYKEAGKIYQKQFAELITDLIDGNIIINNIPEKNQIWNKQKSTQLKNIEEELIQIRKEGLKDKEQYKRDLKNQIEKGTSKLKLKKIEEEIEKFKIEIIKEELTEISKEEKTEFQIISELVEELYKKSKDFNVAYFDIFYNRALLVYYKEEFYIKLFMRNFAKEKFLKIFDKIEDKYYQNSTDKPKEISEKEWKERKEIIDGIFDVGSFKEAGLIAEFDIEKFELEWDYKKKEEIKKYIPSEEKRKKRIAKNKIIEEFYSKLKKNKKEWEKYKLYEEFRKSTEFKKLLEEKIKTIELKEIKI